MSTMSDPTGSTATQGVAGFHDVHQRLGTLTRQLHDSLNGLGLTDKVRTWAGELPDAKSRLSYIARLTGEAAEKVLNSVDQAKAHHDHIAQETRRIGALLAENPTEAVAQGHVAQFVAEVDRTTREIDQNLTDIMMAQDFHDLTGQVITRVVGLAANIEEQLVQLLIVTAPPEAQEGISSQLHARNSEHLEGPVVDAEKRTDVVHGQSEVDDLLASLGF